MRATADQSYPSNVVDLYDSGTGRWSTAQLSQARSYLSATSVGTVAIIAGGFCNGKVIKDCVCLLCEGLLIAVVIRVMGTWVLVFRDGVRERLLSYARHCRR